MSKSKIEWTEDTWNPITGCSKISPGCLNCYAERMHKRLRAMGQWKYQCDFNDVAFFPEELAKPYNIKKPSLIFVCSMSDLFHENVEKDDILKIFYVMKKYKQHFFQVLTKRPERLKLLAEFMKKRRIAWPENIMIGVTVETSEYLYRIYELKEDIPKHIPKFVSFEPLLSRIDLQNNALDGIDWVIVGGESGPGSRPMKRGWVCDIRDYCLDREVPFFFKQWGGPRKKKNDNILDGIVWEEYPMVIDKFFLDRISLYKYYGVRNIKDDG